MTFLGARRIRRRFFGFAFSLLALIATPAWILADDPFRPDSPASSSFPTRSWIDSSGDNKVEARFISATGDAVVLQRADGVKVTVPLSRLSDRDRGYVEGVAAAMSIAKSSPASRSESAGSSSPARPSKTADSPARARPPRAVLPPLKPYTGDAKEIELPDTVGDVSLAAAGRLVLLHLPKTKQVAIYDVNEAKITKFITLSSESARIVGGLTKMVVINPNEGVIERWSLDTFKKETTRPLPFEGVFKAMAMGCASEGPVLIHWAASTDALARCEYKLFDIENFKPSEHEIRGRNSSYRDAVHIRASATGDVFGLWATSHSPQGMEVMCVVGNEVKNAYQHNSAGHLVPSFDGSSILTGYAGVCTPELNQKKSDGAKRVPLVPTTHPKFYVGVPAEPGAQINLGNKPFDGVSPTLHSVGSDSRLINLPDLKLDTPKDNGSWSRGDFTLDKRVFFIVAANQLLSVPFTNDKLIVQPFDWRAELDKADIDYLIVTSVPDRTIYPGDEFRYAIDVATSAGKPKFELSSGPDGMSVSATGVISWKVPADFREERVPVIVSIDTDDGQSVYETFQLECPEAVALRREKAIKPAREDKRAAVPQPQPEPRVAPRSRLPDGLVSREPADHGLEVHINPEGMFRGLVPNPEFSGGGAPVHRRPVPFHERQSPARARLRVYNRSQKTIDALTMTVSNDYPTIMNRDMTVNLLADIAELKPGEGVEVTVNWQLLPNVALPGGAASIKVAVATISSR